MRCACWVRVAILGDGGCTYPLTETYAALCGAFPMGRTSGMFLNHARVNYVKTVVTPKQRMVRWSLDGEAIGKEEVKGHHNRSRSRMGLGSALSAEPCSGTTPKMPRCGWKNYHGDGISRPPGDQHKNTGYSNLVTGGPSG